MLNPCVDVVSLAEAMLASGSAKCLGIIPMIIIIVHFIEEVCLVGFCYYLTPPPKRRYLF